MKKTFAVLGLMTMALAGTAGVAVADQAAPGEWTCQTPSGNEVQGECNGAALVVVNPGGQVPPGQNK
jgi:hypothetical protein